jgi:hypothetical protein
MNVLLINQLAIDFYSCIMITVTYSINLFGIYLSGLSGYLLCLILSGEQLMWIGLNSSAISLVVIAVERYIKIVHAVWHKNHCKRWMIIFGCAFSWVSGFLGNFFVYLFASEVSDGVCEPASNFPSRSGQLAYIWFYDVYYFHLPLIIFVICYVRIFQVIRRQNRIFHQNDRDMAAVAPSSAAGAAAANDRKSPQRHMNAVKTMTFITIFFVVTWSPINSYYTLQTITRVTFTWAWWYASVFIALFNICANPFIYIMNYDDVRVYLSRKSASLFRVFCSHFANYRSGVIAISERVQTGSSPRW